MPNIRSAAKALRQSKKRYARNLAKKKAYKMSFKGLSKLVPVSKSEAQKLLPGVYQKIDKAVKAGIIKPNKAARLKSQAAHLVA